jgi:2,3-dihydroxybiphenyl 1,2-dioxygenase
MVSVSQLGYLGLSVRDSNQWELFAAQVLGLQPNGRDPNGSLFLRMDDYHHRFIVHPTGNDDLAYIGWEVATEESLEAIAEQLRQAGTIVTAGTAEEAEARRVAGMIKFADPSGILSEIFYGPLVIFDKPFQSPRPISGFKTSDQGLGHFVISVDDYQSVLDCSVSITRSKEFAPPVLVQVGRGARAKIASND